MKKIIVMCLLIALGGCVLADPIILAPSATTLSTGQVRAEAALSPGNDQGNYFWFGTGISQFEVNLIRCGQSGGKVENDFGFQWDIIPQTVATPAVAVGLADVGSQSSSGVAPYAVATKRLPVSSILPFVSSFEMTGGLGAGGISGPFLGFDAKLPLKFFLQAEYDSHNLNAAAGWQPTKLFRLKAYSINGHIYGGAELAPITF